MVLGLFEIFSMQDIVKSDCHIPNCHYFYDYTTHQADEAVCPEVATAKKKQTAEVVALRAIWMRTPDEEPDSIHLWGKKPTAGRHYDIEIIGAIAMDTSKNFWVCYEDPIVDSMGYETFESIEAITFCLCNHVATRYVKTKAIGLTVEVIKCVSLSDIDQLPQGKSRCAHLADDMTSDYASISKVDNYMLIETNYQGDCGATYVLKANPSATENWILLVEHHWSYHEYLWYVPNEEIAL